MNSLLPKVFNYIRPFIFLDRNLFLLDTVCIYNQIICSSGHFNCSNIHGKQQQLNTILHEEQSATSYDYVKRSMHELFIKDHEDDLCTRGSAVEPEPFCRKQGKIAAPAHDE